jgi:transposase
MSSQRQQKQQQAKQKCLRKRAQGKRKKRQNADQPTPLVLEANAAGIDVGAAEMYVAVPADRDAEPVQVFGTFTEDLQRLAAWLVACKITTVAMESTGVYWIPLYQLLEDQGLRVCLVNARHMKNVPGRRTDWHECQWLQYLHSVGLLRAAFRPEQAVCAVRRLTRHRAELVGMASQHVQHMQKAMTEMNLVLHNVIDDITGKTGLAIVDAILGGERNPAKLAKLRDSHVKASEETIRKSLVGDYREELLFTLKQSLEMYREYRRKIIDSDKEIQKLMTQLESKVDLSQNPYQPTAEQRKSKAQKKRRISSEDGEFDMGKEAYRIFGVDVTRIPGMQGLNTYYLVGEVGADLSMFPNGGHFVSHKGLCPDNDISGGKVLYRGTRKIKSRGGQIFRMAASSLHHSQSHLGDYYRRMKAKIGPAGANMATARKIASIFFAMVTNQTEYDETKFARQEAERQQRNEQRLKKQARKLGYELVPLRENPAA